MGWQVQNAGGNRLQVLAVRLPHGQFKSEGLRFEPTIDLESGKEINFAIVVRCHEPPGLVTENAFLIFQVEFLAESWRVFVRVQVIVDAEGTPVASVASITTQKVGFSGVQS